MPLDLHVRRRDRQGRQARRLLRQAPGRARARVLRVPDALHASAERRSPARSRRSTSRPARTSTSSSSASIRARRRRWPRREEGELCSSGTGAPAPESGFHFLTGREASIKALDARGRASGTRTTRRSSSSRIRRRSRCSRRTAACRAISRHRVRAARSALALVEAAGGKIGTAVDQALLSATTTTRERAVRAGDHEPRPARRHS